MSSIERQRKFSYIMKEIIEAGEFKISMFNAFHSTYETQHNLDLNLQDIMSNRMTFLDDIQGYTMYFHQSMAQEDSGDFLEAVVKEVNVQIDNVHWRLVPIK